MRSGGLEKLHIIADFDMTLTKHWIQSTTSTEPIRNLSSHAVLERGPAVSEHFAQHTKQLSEHYYPFEIDTSLDIDTKTKLMIEWWSAAHQAMIDEKIKKSQIHAQAEAANMQFRSGLTELLDYTHTKKIPFLVFSAGIADVIEELFRVGSLDRPNQAVISNHMEFPGEGEDAPLVGFKEPLIHTLNKGEQALHGAPTITDTVKDALTRRRNVLLMGDSIGDAKMADGFEHDALLKVGFYNFGDEARRQEFRRTFDVIISGDGALDWVTALLKFLDQPK
ncbi:protein of unknown function [Taphrina deformans PYCC 5710]|uniref:5'-nucleotidase n=1 Tax=Taphrina deformans (strain PYCC 5710 / ATCC 11124 / CBS 356.35 / IMI 108563 / JCM 9778 / NBRC 8474) TaxID=1097556 RepID=R4XHL9_TAPDE|nr:protein of unknown function [Taphrina deformans PYCC 5710]|eukprot:CCG82912.1 protein of unknown function [Taphrina deformans PYCC 5710]